MEHKDTRAIEAAKKAAAGDLGREMGRFPLLFAPAVFFGPPPSKDRPVTINSGTGSLVNLGQGPLCITCYHVLAEYRRRRAEGERVLFMVGNVEVDPLGQLIDQNERLDLAVIRVSADQAKTLASKKDDIGTRFFQPKDWPPPPLKEGEFIAFGGYPAALRILKSFDEIHFLSWSSGASMVHSVSDYQFLSAFEREQWVTSFGAPNGMDLNALGGMSGGPAFVQRGLYWDFVGIVKEHNASYDSMFFASVRWIRPERNNRSACAITVVSKLREQPRTTQAE